MLKLKINTSIKSWIRFENVRKHRDIKLVTTGRRRHTTKFFIENLLAIEMKKAKILMNKPVYLGLSILEWSEILMCEFWYDYVKAKYGEKQQLCYMDTDSFFVYVKTDDIYKDITEDDETRFDTSNFELDRSLIKEKNWKVIGLMKGELGWKIMKKCVGLRGKTYSYLIDYDGEDNKAKGIRKCVIKRKPKFENFEKSLEATKLDSKIKYLEKNKIDAEDLKKSCRIHKKH